MLAHPGYISTNLQTSAPVGMVKLLFGRILALVAQSPAQGALPQLYAATAPGRRERALHRPRRPGRAARRTVLELRGAEPQIPPRR
ncbi:hypothetical protein GCM10022419_120930 [Nonomuraea rosea]|uniref:Uncharacterized protein n=1 Tax=Nonomuraea rosea TaxID=638574 RepID=A0ABP6ZNM7_9ACTN